jgi:alkanesulfonate monooxygenase SsuD/methylene tetrahydromethanopterin reductase-like flavin-dependent oxidoreductase (luciferase family)
MKHWLCVMFEDNSQLCAIARAAEDAGYHGIAVATSTMALAWPVGDPAFASFDAKHDALHAYAAQFLEG